MEHYYCSKCGKRIKPNITFKQEITLTLYCPKCNSSIHSLKSELTFRGVNTRFKGVYIAFEGIDGSGKTCQSLRLTRRLREIGYNVVYVREPWNDSLKMFLYKYSLEPDVETYVFAVDRIILQREIVIKALSEGSIVVSDRSVYASLAYQGARGLPLEYILFVNRVVKPPDIVVLLDLPVDIALKRISGRVKTRFEEKEYLLRVRELYLKLPEVFKNTLFIVVDASKSISEVEMDIWRKLAPVLKEIEGGV